MEFVPNLIKCYFNSLTPVRMNIDENTVKCDNKKQSRITDRINNLRHKISQEKSKDKTLPANVQVLPTSAKVASSPPNRKRGRPPKDPNKVTKSPKKQKPQNDGIPVINSSPEPRAKNVISPKKPKSIAERMKKIQESGPTDKKAQTVLGSFGETCKKAYKSVFKESAAKPKEKERDGGIKKKTLSHKKKIADVTKTSSSSICQSTATSPPSAVLKDFKIPRRPLPNLSTSENEGDGFSDGMEVEVPPDAASAPVSTETAVDCEEKMEWQTAEVNHQRSETEDNHAIGKPDYLPLVESRWMIIIDTNIFISSLRFVQRVLETELPGYGYPSLYLPRRVISELDYLKDKNKLRNKELSERAQTAIKYINKRLKECDPRFQGQNMKDSMELDVIPLSDADDHILLSCIQAKNKHPGTRVMLLSDDVNLRNKAIIEDVETYSASEFQNRADNIPIAESGKHLVTYRTRTLIKVAMEEILNTELSSSRISENSMTLEDAVNMLINRWDSKFSCFVSIFAEEQLVRIREAVNSPDTPGALLDLIEASKKFFVFFYVRGKKYYSTIKKSLSVLESLKSRAEQLGEIKVEEKHYLGCLQTVFNDCWDASEGELQRLRQGKLAGDMRAIARGVEATNTVSQIVQSLQKLLSCSIFKVCSSSAVQSFAEAMAPFCDNDANKCKLLFCKIATTEEGRDLLAKAERYFKCALQKMVAEQ